MKAKIYIKVAIPSPKSRGGYRVHAGTKPDYTPIQVSTGYRGGVEFRPTVSFAIDLNIPDEMFKQAEQTVATINLEKKNGEITGEILMPEIIKFIKAKSKLIKAT